MRTTRLRSLAVCVMLALLTAISPRADAPQPIETIDAWMDDFMTCFRGDDANCLRDVFARHWYPMPELESHPDDPEAFFAFLNERRAFEAPYDFSEFQSAAFDERILSKTFIVGAIVSADEVKAIVLTIGARLVDGELYLFKARLIDDLRKPRLQIDLVDLSP